MIIETKFLMGDGALGSKLQVTITSPDRESFESGLMRVIGYPYPVKIGKFIEGIDGMYLFPMHSGQDWEVVPETGDLKRVTLTGIRVK